MDADLRKLERLAATDPLARARHLRALVRAGRLSESRLRLAAHLGNGPAIIACGGIVAEPAAAGSGAPATQAGARGQGSGASPQTTSTEDLADLITSVATFGREPVVVAAVAVAQLVRPLWNDHPVGDTWHYDRPLNAARDWIRCPCKAHADAVRALTWNPLPSPYRGHGGCGRTAASTASSINDDATATRMAVVTALRGVEAYDRDGPRIVGSEIATRLVAWALTV